MEDDPTKGNGEGSDEGKKGEVVDLAAERARRQAELIKKALQQDPNLVLLPTQNALETIFQEELAIARELSDSGAEGMNELALAREREAVKALTETGLGHILKQYRENPRVVAKERAYAAAERFIAEVGS